MELQETKSSIKNTLHISINKGRNLWPGITQQSKNQINRMEWVLYKTVQDLGGPNQRPKRFYLCKKKDCNKRQLSPTGIKRSLVPWSALNSSTGTGRAQRLACLLTSLVGVGILPMGNTTVFINLPSLSSLYFTFLKSKTFIIPFFWNRPNRSDRQARK